MRFGLHSGPGKILLLDNSQGLIGVLITVMTNPPFVVTAGVLRGEKSRFQLFGDTVSCSIFGVILVLGQGNKADFLLCCVIFQVNTASRIESTGQRNRIQVSQQTADLLVEAGKEGWVVPRKDLVEAK